MLRVRQLPLAMGVFLVACGGNAVTGDDNGSGGGSSTGGTAMGGMMTVPYATGSDATGGGFACDAMACGVDAGPAPAIDSGLCSSGGSVDVGELESDYGTPWKSSWLIRGCLALAGNQCINGPQDCPNGASKYEDRGLIITELFPVGGRACTYSVTFQVNGISEAKYYQGGTRDAGETVPTDVETALLDTFYRGGAPVDDNYDDLRMRVLDSNKKEMARYYLNSAPLDSGLESHRTFRLSYSKTIDVPGGGFVEYVTHDSNCRSTDNFGDGQDYGPPYTPRGIPNEEANPLPAMGIDPDPTNDVGGKHRLVPLAMLNAQNGSMKPWHSQIVHVTITNVVAKEAAP
jgi:hypothetical protein